MKINMSYPDKGEPETIAVTLTIQSESKTLEQTFERASLLPEHVSPRHKQVEKLFFASCVALSLAIKEGLYDEVRDKTNALLDEPTGLEELEGPDDMNFATIKELLIDTLKLDPNMSSNEVLGSLAELQLLRRDGAESGPSGMDELN